MGSMGGGREKEREREEEEEEEERDRLKLPNNTDGDCTGTWAARNWLLHGCRQNPPPVIFRLHTQVYPLIYIHINPNRDAKKDKRNQLQANAG